MIFVTLGTQPHQFDRLLKVVDQIDDHVVVIQRGNTKYLSKKHQSFDFSSEYQTYLKQADIIITHGGVGSIIEALEQEKYVIVMPRLQKYHEHVDDHQLEITNKFVAKNYIKVINNYDELKDILDKQTKLSKFESNQDSFNNKLVKILGEL